MIWTQLPIAFVVSGIIAGLAFWRGSLSRSGVVGALLVGTLILGLGGWVWGVLLGTFFVTSTMLSHFKEGEKKEVAAKFDKGHQRDFGQTMANGGVGAIVAILSVVWPDWPWFPFFVGVMATVTADTWATELGTLSQQPPRLITSGRVVEVGTSGGVSLLGTAVSVAGGVLIGLLAGALTSWPLLMTTLAGAAGGLAGSLFDSLLGATVQQIYWCDVCGKEVEKRFHCGQRTRPWRGWAFLNNDRVNLVASLIGGLIATLFMI